MYWHVTIETPEGEYYCCVHCPDHYTAELRAMDEYSQNCEVCSIHAVEFNTFQHGEPRDYFMIT